MEPGERTSRAGWFATTHWSQVLAAGGQSNPDATVALEALCRTYWYPLYAYLRRQSYGVHDAQDLTQSFFVHLLAGERLQTVHPAKGKFRSFLLASLKNFLNNEHDRRQALKRGGQITFVSVDEALGEEQFQREPAHTETPDKAFEQSWAVTLLGSVLAQLRSEYVRESKAEVFEALQVYLAGDGGGAPYVATGQRLGLGESGVKMAVLRLRRRFGELLRTTIAHTVTRPEEVEEEIRHLFAAVSR